MEKQSKYPSLAKLAKKMLAILSTSTPLEHVFLRARKTVVPKPTSLDSNTVDELVFFHSCLAKKGLCQQIHYHFRGEKEINDQGPSIGPSEPGPSQVDRPEDFESKFLNLNL